MYMISVLYHGLHHALYHMLSNLYYDTIRGTFWKHVASLETIFQSTICIMISVGCTSVGTVFLVQIFIFNKLKHLHSEPLLFQKEKSWLQLWKQFHPVCTHS